MNNFRNKIKQNTSNTPSKWRENAEYRKNNRWLSYSSQIARRIIAIIKKREELNQVKLAELVGVTPQQISKIVKGHENLTLETIYKLSKALSVELISFPEYEYSVMQKPTTGYTEKVVSSIWAARHGEKVEVEMPDADSYVTNKDYIRTHLGGIVITKSEDIAA